MATDSTFFFNPEANLKYQTLLEISQIISKHRDLYSLFSDLTTLLPQIVTVDILTLSLHDSQRHIMKDVLFHTNVIADIEGGKEWTLESHPAGAAFQTQQPILVSDIMQDSRYPDAFSCMREDGVHSLCVFPLTTAFRKVGSLLFASWGKEAYREADFEFLDQVAKQVAVAVDNVLHFQELTKERDHSRLVLEVNNAVVSTLNLQKLFVSISASLRKIIPHVNTSLCLYDSEAQTFQRLVQDFPEGKGFAKAGGTFGIEDSPAGKAFHSSKTFVWDDSELMQYDSDIARKLLAEGIKSGACAPLVIRDQVLGTLNLGSVQAKAFEDDLPELLTQVATQVAIGLDNALAYQKIKELNERLEQENVYLRDEIRTVDNFEEIIGESVELNRVLQQLEIVAPTDSTVLIQGETGTGKELIARALHRLSSRKEQPFVKLNCAAIPTGLIESELFGHEKGAFTGAIAQKLGRFELAHRGTIFLDEIGELSVELQTKLLRVLQEKEFERLGGHRTIQVDIRLVAATNRDLAKMVEANQFRHDLYYRVNVFPIAVPSLRDRPEDIPVLVRYFTHRHATRMNKTIKTVSQKTMDQLSRYHWPGNVRELENLIERAVILSQGSELLVPLEKPKHKGQKDLSPLVSLEEAEREHIIRALRECKWIIGGPAGAAIRLGMKRTTLASKIKKLAISRPT